MGMINEEGYEMNHAGSDKTTWSDREENDVLRGHCAIRGVAPDMIARVIDPVRACHAPGQR